MGGVASLYSQWRRFLVCMPADQEGEHARLLVFAPLGFRFSEVGGGDWGFRRLPTLGGDSTGMHISG